jgi:hypothetical protein
LCGEGVTADYPHDETRNPGVNHFPDGVFQKCRIITIKERDAERERLRKMKRMKVKNSMKAKQRRSSRTNFTTPAAIDNGWDRDSDPLFTMPNPVLSAQNLVNREIQVIVMMLIVP